MIVVAVGLRCVVGVKCATNNNQLLEPIYNMEAFPRFHRFFTPLQQVLEANLGQKLHRSTDVVSYPRCKISFRSGVDALIDGLDLHISNDDKVTVL